MIQQDPDEYVLFIDETGTASTKDTRSKYYILSGLVIKESEREKLRNFANNIKYKFWNDTSVVLHSVEIGRREGKFRLFRQKGKLDAFLDDLENYLFKRSFRLIYVLVDKDVARQRNWNDIKVYKETSDEIIKNFLLFLLSRGARGKIVIESATAEKDIYFTKSLTNFLAGGLPAVGVTHSQVKNALTSISFVTKDNLDTEEQLADLFAYAARCHYLQQNRIQSFKNRYELLMMKVLASRLLTKDKASVVKPKYSKKLQSQVRLPS